MDTNPSRRALIGGVGLAAAVTATPALPAITTLRRPANSIRPEFQAAFDAIDAAGQHARAFDTVVDAAKARSTAMEAELPHVTFTSGLNVMGQPLRYSTDSAPTVAVCETIVRRGGDKREPYVADARRIVAAVRRRERAIARVREASGWNTAYDQDVRNNDAIVEAESDFLSMPVVSLAELALKVDTLTERDCWDDAGRAGWVADDIRRLMKQEG